jgi:D-alanyl-D-alanine carboxypeptidase
MRRLLAENLDKAATTRTATAISDRGSNESIEVADAGPQSAPTVQAAPTRSISSMSKVTAAFAAATAAVPPTPPAPLTSGVIQTPPMAVIPGSSEPMKPVRVKTVQVKAAPTKLASAAPAQMAPATTTVPPPAASLPETSNAVVGARSDAEMARTDLPPQPPGHGTGNGLLGVLPASAVAAPSAPAPQAMAYAAPPPAAPQPQPALQDTSSKPVVRTGWIVQVGALESESEAQQRIEAARNGAHGLLSKADPFTEPVMAKGDRKLYRARFAGLDRDQAEAVCKALKRSDISCMTVHN